MMTKEEFIENAIEYRKRGIEHVHSHMCNKFANCKTCPISNGGSRGCLDAYIDEIIRLREEKLERKETNLEHYFTDKWTRSYEGYLDKKRLLLCCDESTMNDFNNNTFTYNLIDWLLAPYEPPKKYQMTQLCYDIIKRYVETCENPKAILKFTVFYDVLRVLDFYEESWKEIRLEDLLENAEVVEE